MSDEYVVVPFLVQDRLYLRRGDAPPGDDAELATPIGEVVVRGEGPYLDGPAANRVAVVDMDADTGRPRPGARLKTSKGPRRRYDLGAELDADSPVEAFESDAFIQVSAFATVMRTIMFFEGADAVGRRVPWSCGPRLTVVPRAGALANAFYDRASGSLRFFSFPSPDGYQVHAALSHDLVCHETAHALLDGMRPDLYDAITPQSLAIHEALADLTALSLTLLNEQIVFSHFAISGAQVDTTESLSRLAEEFGANARRSDRVKYLRSASNDRTLDPTDRSLDRAGGPNLAGRTDVYGLSEVLTGAVFSVFRDRFEASVGGSSSDDESFVAQEERAVSVAAKRMIRMVFRALDHLPPGEISLADVGRAIVASDAAAGGREADRTRFASELVRRGVVGKAAELETPINIDISRLGGADLVASLADDAAARAFAESNRALLRIPEGRDFEVLPRYEVPATARGGASRLAFRVRWTSVEEHDLGPRFGREWVVPAGTTMIIDGSDDLRAVTLLTSDGGDPQRADRGAMLRQWAEEGRLVATDETARGAVEDAMVARGARDGQRVSGTGRHLHAMSAPPPKTRKSRRRGAPTA